MYNLDEKIMLYLFIQGYAKSLLLLGRFSSCHAWASHCSGFSCFRVWALGCARGLSSCGTWAQQLWFLRSRAQAQWCGALTQLLHGVRDLPRSGIREPMSPALAGGFFTTEPLRKPLGCFFFPQVNLTAITTIQFQNIFIAPVKYYSCSHSQPQAATNLFSISINQPILANLISNGIIHYVVLCIRLV